MKTSLTTLLVLLISFGNAQNYITHTTTSDGYSIWDADDIEFEGITISIQGYCNNGTEGIYISIKTNNGLEYDHESTAVVTTRTNMVITHINSRGIWTGPWLEYHFLLSNPNSRANWMLDEFIDQGFKTIKMSNGNASKTYTVDVQTSTRIVTYLTKVRASIDNCYD